MAAVEISVERADYIPYACHLDEATLLTKNGELLQTFKIEGYQFDTLHNGKKADLRLELRRVFQLLALHPHFCATFHIVRRRRNLNPTASVDGFFAGGVEEKWKNAHRWQDDYSNDLYFTLVHEGSNFALSHVGQFFRSFFFQAEKFTQRKQLEKARERLTETMDKCIAELAHFAPKKLKIVEENGTAYSEPLSLLHHLLNLEQDKKMPVPVSDISDYLVAYPLEIGFNTLEVHRPDNKGVRHASIYSVKQYSEMSPSAIDVFLQYPGEFIITQQVMLGVRPDFIASLEYKKHMAELGDDKDFIRFSGIEDLLDSNRGQWSDYALQQSTITIIANSAAQLESMSGRFMAALGSVGVVAVREDVMLEHVYYSQLPGNFEFLKRQQPINTIRIGGYTTLYDFPTGKLQGNPWGPAISTLKTVRKNPYFFSFHRRQNDGHTLIAGSYGSNKTQLLNFMMAQAERVQPRVIWFDTHRSAEMLIRALGGGYMQLVRNKEVPRRPMNPLKLPDTPENRKFLEQWLRYLVLDLEGVLKAETSPDFAEMVRAVFALPAESRQISKLSLTLPEPLATYLQQWIGTGRYGHLFDNAVDETFLERRIEGFDMTEMVQDRRPQWATLSYLMHRALQLLDGKPTIFVFDEAWTLLDNPVFSPQLLDWLDQLQKHNAIAILATENMDGLPLSTMTTPVLKKIATRILFPDSAVTGNFQNLMGLNPWQFQQFLSMEREQAHVFIQQGEESVVVNMQLPEMRGIVEVLNGLPMQVTRMENVIAKAGTAPEQWLPEFYKQV